MKNFSKPIFLIKQERKILLFMSNFFIVFLLLSLNVSATVLGQRVSLSMTDATLEDCIKSIEKQTELGFFYKARQVKRINGIDISMYDAMVSEVLEEVLAGTDLIYEIDKDVIVLKSRPLYKSFKAPVVSENKAEIQKQVVKGVVRDEAGLTLPGATIIEKGTTNGVTTDSEGNYSIEVAGQNSVLEFSFLGYQQQDIAVGSRTVIDVVMVLNVNELEEAIVIGYGSSKKKDLTGSVVRVSSKTFESSSFTDMGQALQGQVAGMEVLSGTGRPGDQVRIRIRGESSLMGDANPLIVLDDIPMPDNYDLNLINPNDIQSIDILKGASAAAIYGSKGSAGVVLITTKQGGQGNVEVFYDGNISTQNYVDKMESLDADDFKKLTGRSYFGLIYNLYNRIYPGRYKDIRANPSFSSLKGGYFEDANTNWMDVMTQTPINTNHSLGIKGGTKEASYYASFGYTTDEGRVIGNSYNRITANLNMDLRPTKWFEMGFRVNGAKSNTVRGEDMSTVMQARPDLAVYDENGDYYHYWSPAHGRFRDNPLELSLEAPKLSSGLNYTLSGYARVVFSKNLRYQITASWSESRGETRNYYPSYTYTGQGGWAGGVTGVLNAGNNYSNQANIDNVLYYTFTNDRHDISAMVGTTFNQDKDGYMSHEYQDFPDDEIQNVAYNAVKWNYTSGSDDASAYFSVYSRANYKFMNRYLLTATIRRDASSKFAPAYRAGLFPSAAVAWVISEEDFLKYNPVQLSFLKLRIGYGVTGNNRIGRYAWRSSFGSTQYFDEPGVYPVTIGNDQVRWEETTQIDIGLDYGFWQNRIMGSLGWYTKDTDGLLFGYSLAPSAGLTSINMNFAQIVNSGLEFDIRAQVIENPTWSLMLGFNIANNRGKVMKLSKDVVGDTQGNDPGYYATTVLREGDPVGLIYGFRVEKGVYDPASGAYIYKDLNEDGTINQTYDREVIGNSVPDFFGGFNIDARYKRITARLVGKFSYGAQKHWTGLQDQFHINTSNPDNVMKYGLYAYTPDNPDAPFQAFGAGWEKYISDNYLFDASYLKLADMRVGYDLPENWVSKIGLSNINVYGSINNILTLTTYPGTNVESYSTNAVSGAGLDYSTYPLIRTFTFGIKAMLR